MNNNNQDNNTSLSNNPESLSHNTEQASATITPMDKLLVFFKKNLNQEIALTTILTAIFTFIISAIFYWYEFGYYYHFNVEKNWIRLDILSFITENSSKIILIFFILFFILFQKEYKIDKVSMLLLQSMIFILFILIIGSFNVPYTIFNAEIIGSILILLFCLLYYAVSSSMSKNNFKKQLKKSIKKIKSYTEPADDNFALNYKQYNERYLENKINELEKREILLKEHKEKKKRIKLLKMLIDEYNEKLLKIKESEITQPKFIKGLGKNLEQDITTADNRIRFFDSNWKSGNLKDRIFSTILTLFLILLFVPPIMFSYGIYSACNKTSFKTLELFDDSTDEKNVNVIIAENDNFYLTIDGEKTEDTNSQGEKLTIYVNNQKIIEKSDVIILKTHQFSATPEIIPSKN